MIYTCVGVCLLLHKGLRLLQSKVLGGGYSRFSTISNFSNYFSRFTAQFSPPSKTKSPVTVCERCVNIPNPK